MRFKIKKYAYEQGMRLNDVARKLRMPLSNLSAIASGRRSVSLNVLGKVAKVLNCRVPELFDEPALPCTFRARGLDQCVAQIEAANPIGRDKSWIHRLMLAQRSHYRQVLRVGGGHEKKS